MVLAAERVYFFLFEAVLLVCVLEIVHLALSCLVTRVYLIMVGGWLS